ncbi:MAG TPA: hypothetical protein VF391_16070, partial [Dermatophilaceae bacterium]
MDEVSAGGGATVAALMPGVAPVLMVVVVLVGEMGGVVAVATGVWPGLPAPGRAKAATTPIVTTAAAPSNRAEPRPGRRSRAPGEADGMALTGMALTGMALTGMALTGMAL